MWRSTCRIAAGIALLLAWWAPARPAQPSAEVPAHAEDPGAAADSGDAPARPGTEEGDTAQTLASVLAAALQAVHDHYAGSARPVPTAVRERLAPEYASELARARYVVSRLAFRVLATVDRHQGTALSDGLHAVTVDDLIVFSSEPGATDRDLWMWAHELHHVHQYQERGTIHEFARAYLSDCEAIERAADERANRVLGTGIRLRHCLR